MKFYCFSPISQTPERETFENIFHFQLYYFAKSNCYIVKSLYPRICRKYLKYPKQVTHSNVY